MRKISNFWKERAYALIQNNPKLGDKAIERELAREGERLKRNDWPSERSIRRLRQEYLARPEVDRHQYQLFSWPGAMERGDLPWGASPVALELLRYNHERALGRPPVRVVKWFWRVSLAAPDAPINERLVAAQHLAAWEVLGTLPAEEARRVEWFLAYAPWRSEYDAQAYRKACEQYLESPERPPAEAEPVPPFARAEAIIPAGADFDTFLEVLSAIHGISLGGVRGQILEKFKELDLLEEVR